MTIRIAAAQTEEFRDDLDASLACLGDFARRAAEADVRLLCFPEGFLQGYLLNEGTARRAALDLSSPGFAVVLERFPRGGPVLVIGIIETAGEKLFNTAIVVDRGVLVGRYRKVHLLDGETLFTPGSETPVFDVGGLRFGINICYDTNFPEAARRVADQGASLLVCPANNMMRRDRAEEYKHAHNAIRGERCRETGLWLLSSDVTGTRDGRVAWGPTAVLNPSGEVVSQLPLDQTGLLIFDLPGTSALAPASQDTYMER